MEPRAPRVYLAGPEVFLPNALAVGEAKKSVCALYRLVGLFPLDNEIAASGEPYQVGIEIYRGNVGLLESADAVVANLTPFRGPHADPGTAFELGYAAARNLVRVAYSTDPRLVRQRIPARSGDAEARDADGLQIEDFGMRDNLMLEACLSDDPPSILVPHGEQVLPLDDLDVFRRAVARVAMLLGIAGG